MAHLVHQDQHVDLQQVCRLGRQRDNDVVLLDPKAGREHCRIERRGADWVLIDLGSVNGTQLNGERIHEEAVLRHADRIGVGRLQITFFATDPQIATRIHSTGWNQQALEGRLLGRNRLQRVLAEGVISSMYQARQLDLDRPTAVRIFHPELISSGVLVGKDIAASIHAAGRVRSPIIAAMHEYGEEAGLLWYSMEFVEGETLAALLHRQGRLDLPAALAMVQRLARGLEQAHAAGVCHHDLSPESVMLSREGRVKLLNLGIAPLLTHQNHLLRLRRDRHCLAPEQFRGEAAGPAADAYALGCMMFWLLAGRPPFDGHDDLAKEHLTRPAPRLSLFARDVAPALDDLLRQILEKLPENRLSDMQRIGQELRMIRHGDRPGRSDSTQMAIELGPVPEAPPPPGSRRVLRLLLLLLLVVLALAVFLLREHLPLSM